MSYYKKCEICGSHLDPGEVCDCKKKAAHGGTNTESGGSAKRPTNHKMIVSPQERKCQYERY